MKELGTIRIVVPDEWSFRVSPNGEAQILADAAGGTLTGEVEVSRSEDFMADASTYIFQMEREVPES